MFYNRLNDALHPDTIRYRVRTIIGNELARGSFHLPWIISEYNFILRANPLRHGSSVFRDSIVSPKNRDSLRHRSIRLTRQVCRAFHSAKREKNLVDRIEKIFCNFLFALICISTYYMDKIGKQCLIMLLWFSWIYFHCSAYKSIVNLIPLANKKKSMKN